MKVELKEIIDQLTETIELKPWYQVSALIDTDNNDKLCGWMIVLESEDRTKFNKLKELLKAYVCEPPQ